MAVIKVIKGVKVIKAIKVTNPNIKITIIA